MRRAGLGQGRDLVPAHDMSVDEAAVDQPIAHQHVQHGIGQGRIAARPQLQMQIGRRGGLGADRIDHDLFARRFGQPVFMRMRR